MIPLQFCSIETEKNFVFCCHSKNKTGKKIKLSITDTKENEGSQQILHVNYCPFCGFTEE